MALTKAQIVFVFAAYRWGMKRGKQRTNRRQVWVNDLFLERQGCGHCHRLIPKLINNKRFELNKFIGMDEPTFRFLVNLLEPNLQKFSTFRQPISVKEKLAISF